MSQSLRQIKSRITSVENTKKIMRAMEMVSVSKLRKTESPLRLARNYFSKLDQLLHHLSHLESNRVHPVFTAFDTKRNVPVGKLSADFRHKNVLCVFTSDTGLCAAYNNRILAAASQFLDQNRDREFQIIAVGKKGLNYFRKRGAVILKSFVDHYGRFSVELSDKIGTELFRLFSEDVNCSIFLAYTRFESSARFHPAVEKLIELSFAKSGETMSSPKISEAGEYIVEPSPARVWENFFPEYIRAKIRRVLLESFMSEHSARTIAMKQATDNAKELLEGLVLLRNKMRQYSITKEVIEIISSAEALK